MSSDTINEEWKKILTEIDSDYGHHNPYKFLEEINDVLFKNYEKERDFSKKHKLIRNVWYTDTLKEYIYFLEKELSGAIKKLKRNEEGFDNRNKLLKKKDIES